jgi:predicted RND superfamily exporter protein
MEALLQQASDIATVIQLAVAPVFLLAGIAGTLNVLATRLSRIIDRGRVLNDKPYAADTPEFVEVDGEQRLLARRSRLINRAIAFSTMSSLFVCLVIVVLFLDAMFSLRLEKLIAAMFILALLSLISALLLFLREVGLSLRAFRFGPYKVNRF